MKTYSPRVLREIISDCHHIETKTFHQELRDFATKLRRQAQRQLKEIGKD